MNNLTIFKNEEFGEIRTVQLNNETYFVGKDVATALGYTNPQKAVRDHVVEEDRGMNEMDTPSGRQNLVIVNESGLYALIFGSKLESAKRFKHWVTSEVLPSIRKNGGYIAGQEILTDDELLAKALMVAQNKIAEKDALIQKQQMKIEMDEKKVVFADAVSASQTSILVGDLAKLIKQNGVDVGQKRLFQWMREKGYLIRNGASKNMPTQKAMEMKLFEVKESTISNPDGSIRTTRTTKVTGKGQLYFINKFLNKDVV